MKRVVTIQAPTEVAAGGKVVVTVSARTEVGAGEEIGFLHAEYSIDEGRTWTQFCYAEKPGVEMSRQAVFAVNPKGGKAMVRVRVAFRGGAAGDVDCKGGAIEWNGSWEKWRSPAAKYAIIYSPKS